MNELTNTEQAKYFLHIFTICCIYGKMLSVSFNIWKCRMQKVYGKPSTEVKQYPSGTTRIFFNVLLSFVLYVTYSTCSHVEYVILGQLYSHIKICLVPLFGNTSLFTALNLYNVFPYNFNLLKPFEQITGLNNLLSQKVLGNTNLLELLL